MALNDYHFVTTWRVEGSVRDVLELLSNGPDLARWWPSVYLSVQELEPGDERGIGKVVSLYTKGWLPYTLRWKFRVGEASERTIVIQAWGDFNGRGIWTFAQDGAYVNITYDWRISAEKPLLRLFSPLLKPLFKLNHLWAMRRGEQSLQLELARRRARTAQERALIPPPPAPTTTSSMPLLLAALASGLSIYLVFRRLRQC